MAKYICPQRFSYKPLRIITSLVKSSSFCCFRDRWYIMGNKAYNYIFHKVSFDFIVSILLESAGQGNKPSSDSLSFSEKLDAGSGGRGRKGEGWGCGRSNIPFPLLPALTNSGWNVFSPPPKFLSFNSRWRPLISRRHSSQSCSCCRRCA